VNLTYLGEGGISTPLNPDILDSSVYLFVVEDDIMAWSSVEEKEVLTHNVFRENALTNEQVELQAAETWTHQVEWVIPDIIDYMSGHEDHDGNAQEGEHPIPTPINPAKISVVAVVYDNDDTSRTTSSGKTGNAADTPRAANSATPKTTAYDEQNEPPKVVSYDEKLNGNIAEVIEKPKASRAVDAATSSCACTGSMPASNIRTYSTEPNISSRLRDITLLAVSMYAPEASAAPTPADRPIAEAMRCPFVRGAIVPVAFAKLIANSFRVKRSVAARARVAPPDANLADGPNEPRA
jgi:hypothetical protein